MSDICSAETRGRRAPGIGGCGVGGVGTRLAGYSRGGGAGSRRRMALTENRLLKQHDISWNESTENTHSWRHTPVYASVHTNWHAAILLLLCHFPLLDYFSPRTSGFLKAAMSSSELPFKGVFICSLLTLDSVRATPGFIYVANYFSPPPSPFHLYLSFPLLSSFSSGVSKPNTVNEP